MPNENLDFSFDLGGVDRQAILQEAGSLIDAGRSHLSGGSGIAPATAEGDLVRELMQDRATLAVGLVPYRITDKDFLDRQRPVPVRAALVPLDPAARVAPAASGWAVPVPLDLVARDAPVALDPEESMSAQVVRV